MSGAGRALAIRPGARFTCRGDGLCCSDVHLWGPVSEDEAEALSLISEDVILRRPGDGTRVLAASTEGRCLFWQDGCALHAALGPMGKPHTCRKFPFAIVRTPAGDRVAVTYRCSCVSLPSDVPLSEREVRASVEEGGRFEPDVVAPERIALDDDREVSFDEWLDIERTLLARLATEEPEAVLDAEPPDAPDILRVLAEALSDGESASRADIALLWFAGTQAGPRPQPRRPWGQAFEAEVAERPARDILAEWLADDLWALDWADGCTFAFARSIMALRVAAARSIARAIEALGTRPDRAMAEAVFVVTITGLSEPWAEAVRALRARAASR